MKSISLLVSCALFTANAYAFFCPTNFNQIDMGNTQQQIEEACGKPASITDTVQEPADNSPQEWSYFVKQDPNLGSTIPGNIKATIAFDQSGKVINMTINGLSVSTANFCGSAAVKIGSMRDTVKKECGAPAYINRGVSEGPAPQQRKLVEYRYDSTPPITLIFENGMLIDRK